MFGYVKPYIPELKVRQNALYKAYYCGLCKRQKKLTGFFSSFSLSYDFVALAMIRGALLSEKPQIKNGICAFNPLRKKQYVAPTDSLDYTARVAAVLSYYKLKDDIEDGSFLKKIGSYFLLPFFSYAKKKAMKAPMPEKEISSSLKKLSAIEKHGEKNPDIPAGEFGNLLAACASFGIEDDVARFAIEKIFSSLGRWIYIADALDDMPKDRKNGNYNPYVLSSADTDSIIIEAEMALSEADKIINALPGGNGDIASIIRNIFLLGTHAVLDEICNKQKNTTKGAKSE